MLQGCHVCQCLSMTLRQVPFWTCPSRTCILIFQVELRLSLIQMNLLFSKAWSRYLFSFGPDRHTLVKMMGLGRQRPPIDCRLDAVLPPSANPLHVIGAPVTVVQPTREAWRDRFRRCPPHLTLNTAIASNRGASCWTSPCDPNKASGAFNFRWPRECGTISRNLRKPHWLGLAASMQVLVLGREGLDHTCRPPAGPRRLLASLPYNRSDQMPGRKVR